MAVAKIRYILKPSKSARHERRFVHEIHWKKKWRLKTERVASKIWIDLFSWGHRYYYWLSTWTCWGSPRLRLFRHGGSAKIICFVPPPPPLPTPKLLDHPRGTACSARNYFPVPNLRPPPRGVGQTTPVAMCVFFTLNRFFYLSTSSTNSSVRAES